jgi:hypothetical protein
VPPSHGAVCTYEQTIGELREAFKAPIVRVDDFFGLIEVKLKESYRNGAQAERPRRGGQPAPDFAGPRSKHDRPTTGLE